MNRNNLSRSIRRTLSPPVTGLAILALAGSAYAGVGGTAYSTIQLSNFVLTDAGTGDFISLGDFTSLNAGETAQASAALDGVSISDSSRRNLGPDGFDSPTADIPLQCVGSHCGSISDNDFGRQNLFGDGSLGHFARGDSLLEGSFINVDGIPLGGETSQVAEVQLDRTGEGETSSRISNNSTFTFSPDRDFESGIEVTFTAFAEMYLRLFQDDFQVDASHDFRISLREGGEDGERIFTFAPDDLNDGITLSSEGVRQVTAPETSYTATTPELFGGQQYTLSIVNQASADARVAVPEPASIALMGLGLILLGGTLARRRNLQHVAKWDVA